MHRNRLPAVCALALLLSGSALGAAQPAAFSSLAELDAGIARLVAGGDTDAFWQRVAAAGTMPLIYGNTAVFLYRGEAETVDWRGDFNGWGQEEPLAGRRLGASDVWEARRSLLPASRLDYKIVLDGDDWILDPLNPHQQVGGYGPNSELRMPGWRPAATTERRPGVPRGTFTDDLWIDSELLGYPVRYRVWSPPCWSPTAGDGPAAGDEEAERLPELYVTDGSDYWRDEMGSMVITLDNLSAEGSMAPILVVFIDPWDRERRINRREEQFLPDDEHRCTFCRFLADELIPLVDASYPTRGASRRALLGTSYGGLNALYMGVRHPHLFSALGVQSPALRPVPWLFDELAAGDAFPGRVFLAVGSYETGGVESAHRLRDLLVARGVDVLYREPPDGHSWGQWRAQLGELLPWLYPPGGGGTGR